MIWYRNEWRLEEISKEPVENIAYMRYTGASPLYESYPLLALTVEK